MKNKRGAERIIKNNFLSLFLVMLLISLGVVIAGNVIVKEGNMDVSNDLNVSGNSFINGSLEVQQLSFRTITSYIDNNANSSNIYIRTKNSIGNFNSFLFNPDGIFISPSSLRAYKDGFDSAAGGANFYLANNANTIAWSSQLSSNNNIDYWFYNSSSWAKKITLDKSGNILFPSETNLGRLFLYGSGIGTNDYGFGMDSTDLVAFFGSGGGMTFKANNYSGTSLVRINGNGDVGIGTSNPSAKLEVVGNVSISQLLKLYPISLPICDSSLDGSFGRNSTGIYYCNSTVWRQFSFVN